MKIVALFVGVVAVLLTLAMLFTAGWVHPPILSTQAGFRGLGMEQLTTPAAQNKLQLANALPDALPIASPAGPKAGRSLSERPGSEGPLGRAVHHPDGRDHDLGRA